MHRVPVLSFKHVDRNFKREKLLKFNSDDKKFLYLDFNTHDARTSIRGRAYPVYIDRQNISPKVACHFLGNCLEFYF